MVLCPWLRFRLAGIVTLGLLLASDTVKPPEGAAEASVTVQAEVPGAFTVAGPQFKLLTRTVKSGVSVSVAVWLAPSRVAAMLAFCALLTVPLETVKVALLWLAATVTLAGAVTTALPLLIETVVVLPAALFSETVHVLVALLPSVEGAQERDASRAASGAGPERETAPEPPLAEIELPSMVEATTPVIWIGIVVADAFGAI